ncbi:MAG: TetR/AcrR family transcriptional regulator C-terminal domain-containing protein [bacterium]|nr:TetR/AcrR family transcriptional regulator C-terminal domain-containing protein [bacterium]
MGRPAKFSRDRLQAAALRLVDRDGVAGLSMRTLARELGTGPMTLYNHVADRADLEVLVVEAVLAEVRWARRRHADWRADARSVATAMWRAVRRHPNAIPLVLVRRSRAAALLAPSEALLAALAGGGLRGAALLVAFRAVTAFVMGFAQAELAGPLATAADEPAAATIARFRALPRARYPQLVEIAGAAARSTAAREFRQGLDALLRGLVPE